MAETASHPKAESFQHQPAASCSCPIHEDVQPFTAPLGIRFADHIDIAPLARETAAAVYESHHSYMDSLPSVNLAHHGVYFQGALVGAITWRYPLISRKRIRYGVDGQLRPEPLDVDDLPASLRPARRVLPSTDEPVVDSEVISGDSLVEGARICMGVRMPNLASAALARSQEHFLQADDRDTRFLLTWVARTMMARWFGHCKTRAGPVRATVNRDRQATARTSRFVSATSGAFSVLSKLLASSQHLHGGLSDRRPARGNG